MSRQNRKQLATNANRSHINNHSDVDQDENDGTTTQREEYSYKKSSYYGTHPFKTATNFIKSIPNLYGLDMSEDETADRSQGHRTHRNRQFNNNENGSSTYDSLSLLLNNTILSPLRFGKNLVFNLILTIVYILYYLFLKIRDYLSIIYSPFTSILSSLYSYYAGYGYGNINDQGYRYGQRALRAQERSNAGRSHVSHQRQHGELTQDLSKLPKELRKLMETTGPDGGPSLHGKQPHSSVLKTQSGSHHVKKRFPHDKTSKREELEMPSDYSDSHIGRKEAQKYSPSSGTKVVVSGRKGISGSSTKAAAARSGFTSSSEAEDFDVRSKSGRRKPVKEPTITPRKAALLYPQQRSERSRNMDYQDDGSSGLKSYSFVKSPTSKHHHEEHYRPLSSSVTSPRYPYHADRYNGRRQSYLDSVSPYISSMFSGGSNYVKHKLCGMMRLVIDMLGLNNNNRAGFYDVSRGDHGRSGQRSRYYVNTPDGGRGDSDYYSGEYTDNRGERTGLDHTWHTLRNMYQHRRHRRDGLGICSFPCPFLLIFFLMPLLLGLLMRRLGYNNQYLINESPIKEYYGPFKTRLDDIVNDKIYPNLPHMPTHLAPNLTRLTRLPSVVLNDSYNYLSDTAKHLKDNLNPFSYYYTSSEDGIVKRGVDSLVKELDSLKGKLERLEKNYFLPKDEDWWKSKDGDDDRPDIRLLVEDVVDKSLHKITDNKWTAGTTKTVEKYYESLNGMLTDLKTRFKALSDRTEKQEEKVAKNIDDLTKTLLSNKNKLDHPAINDLIRRVDQLNRHFEGLSDQIARTKSDTEELSKFASKCCTSASPGTKNTNELSGGDINTLFSKIKLSDMDASTKAKFVELLREHFASHHKLDELKHLLSQNIEKINKDLVHFKNNVMTELKDIDRTDLSNTGSQTGSKISVDDRRVRTIVEEMLEKYSADRLGLPDYALESAGGSIISTRCSETYDTHSALIKLFGIPIWYRSNSPRIAIQPGNQPGQCWAFKGASGYMVVHLAARIKPTAFTIEHIPRSLSPSGDIDTATKDFSVWGLRHEKDIDGELLGRYRYEKTGRPIQTFATQNPTSEHFDFVELKIESNWGNPNYTCLYRFRVHGEP